MLRYTPGVGFSDGTFGRPFRIFNGGTGYTGNPGRTDCRIRKVARMRRIAFFALLAGMVSPCLAQARTLPIERGERACTSCRSLDLAINGFGVSFGNSTRFTGLRFNLVDRDVEEIKGINLTFWKPRENPNAVIRGITLGLVAPEADRIEGISAGAVAVVGGSGISGISAAGLAVVSDGGIAGMAFGGLATVAEGGAGGLVAGGLASVIDGRMTGACIGGLASVVEGSMTGLSFGGLASVTEGGFSGISFGGLASVIEGPTAGISLGGLASVTEGGLSGISAGGLASVVEGDVVGVMAAGLACVTDQRLSGFGAAGCTVRSGEISGAALAGAYVKAHELSGFSAATVNYFDEYQVGLSIGIVNIAERLNGIQLGIINIARNNSPPFKVLPLINAHFE